MFKPGTRVKFVKDPYDLGMFFHRTGDKGYIIAGEKVEKGAQWFQSDRYPTGIPYVVPVSYLIEVK
jgi:hypothetical protein